MNPILCWPLHPFVCGVLEPDVVYDVPVDFLDPRETASSIRVDVRHRVTTHVAPVTTTHGRNCPHRGRNRPSEWI